MSSPNALILSSRHSQAWSISSWPVRNKRISPSGSVRWICNTVICAASM
uniref:Uncharacterized protein n=1 Tax=Arundo donax TaxID=35708 RepID=A0A0A9F3S0_ARUDO